jgi:pimeloyl-ACP methyl ester carboxylesterase
VHPRRLVVTGTGPPLILIPGIQGRWEWMKPAVDALSRHHRVLTFSLDDVPDGRLFDAFVTSVDEAIRRTGVSRPSVVGISFGGVLAVRYAARRPDAIHRLVLVSAPGPTWRIDEQSASHVRQPLLRLPLFAARAARRVAPEAAAALPDWTSRGRFAVRHSIRTLRSPANPRRMAGWVREWMQTDLSADARHVQAPTLVVTGEPHLDRVVEVSSSLEYLEHIPGARHRTIAGTGHMGLILKPDEFQQVVTEFITEEP